MSDINGKSRVDRLKDFRAHLIKARVDLLLRLEEEKVIEPDGIFYRRLMAAEQLLVSVDAALQEESGSKQVTIAPLKI